MIMGEFPDEKAAAHVTSRLTGETVTSVSRLTTGNQNYVYAVDTEQSAYVIRMTTKFKDKFVSALYWQGQIIPLGVPLAKFIAQDLGGQYSPFPALLMKRLPGADIGKVYPSLTAEQKKNIARQMVGIHAKLSALPDGSKYGYTPDPPHDTWVDFLAKDLNVASDRIKRAQIFDKNVTDIALSFLDSLNENLLKIRPRPFMPDTTVKNVIINEGALMGIVDVDDICYGDPLFTLSLTYAGSEIDGHDTEYADAWAGFLDLDLNAQRRLEFYRLLHTIWFMGEQAITSANGQRLSFDTEKLKNMFTESVKRLENFMNIKIKNATPTDAKEICQLLQTVQNLHATLYPAIFRHVDHAALAEQVTQIISDPAFHLRVAILDDVVAGYAMFKVDGCESSDLIHPHRYLFLEQIAVAPTFRRKGIATALLNDFKTYAAQMGFTEVRLDVWGANADAHACFEKAGFSAYNYRMTSRMAESGNSKTTDTNE